MPKIALSKPIDAHGEQINKIDLAEPTNGDLIDLGDPFTVHADESIEFKNDVIARYVSRLAKIPMSSVREMAIADFWQCKTEIMGFLGTPGGN